MLPLERDVNALAGRTGLLAGGQTPPPTPSPPPQPAGYVMHWRGGMGPETSLRYPFKVTHGLDYFRSQRALAYRLDAISQGRKNS
jgi:hypothetical protein